MFALNKVATDKTLEAEGIILTLDDGNWTNPETGEHLQVRVCRSDTNQKYKERIHELNRKYAKYLFGEIDPKDPNKQRRTKPVEPSKSKEREIEYAYNHAFCEFIFLEVINKDFCIEKEGDFKDTIKDRAQLLISVPDLEKVISHAATQRALFKATPEDVEADAEEAEELGKPMNGSSE